VVTGSLAGVVATGPLLVAMFVAVVAGLASFLSPCVLPLVPGYMSYVTGLAGAELLASGRPERKVTVASRLRMLSGAGLFVAGFTVVFVFVVVTVSQLGAVLIRNERTVETVVGALTILLGVAFAGWLPGFRGERRVHYLPRVGLLGAPILGVTFALGWTPCVTPTLSAVTGLASVEGSAGRAVLLSVAYSAGLGLPFVGFALFARWGVAFVAASRPYRRVINVVGAALLVAVGMLLLTGEWAMLMNWLRASAGPSLVSV
jgi:cytochrome c-type biogenesis protein